MKVQASYHQERLWFVDQFTTKECAESKPIYFNIPLILEITGAVDIPMLEQSIREVIHRHEALRTRIITSNDLPVQHIEEDVHFSLLVRDFSLDEKEINQENLFKLALNEATQPFNLEDPLIRGRLLKLGKEKYILVCLFHHMIADKKSTEIFLNEMLDLYQAHLKGEEPQLPKLNIHYADFSQWQRKFPPRVMKPLLRYWKTKLKGEIQSLELPVLALKKLPVNKNLFKSSVSTFELFQDVIEPAERYAEKQNTSLYILLLTVFHVLLYRYTGLEEITTGTTVLNRNQPDTEQVIGPLANLLPLRNKVERGSNFAKILRDLDRVKKEALKYQNIPFDRLVRELKQEGSDNQSPLFDVLFQYQEKPILIKEPDGVKIQVIETNLGWGNYDLSVLIQKGETFKGIITYNSENFDNAFITRLIEHFKGILKALIAEPLKPVSRIPLITREEKKKLIKEWNQTESPFPREKTLQSVFNDQVIRTPGKIALMFQGREVTYRELNEKSCQLAGYLQKKGVTSETIVGVLTERSIEMMEGIFAILKAGGAYLPINPKLPGDRISFILRDSQTDFMLTNQEELPFEASCDILRLHKIHPFIEKAEETTEFDKGIPEQLAYVIYTSGSTGNPKGVLIEQASIINRIHWMQKQYPIGDQDILIQKTPFVFDVSVWELFWWSFSGSSLYILKEGEEKDPAFISEAIKKNHITVIHFVPSMLNTFLSLLQYKGDSSGLSDLRWVFCSGEALGTNQVQKFYEMMGPESQAGLVNLYGPTEAAVDVTYFDVEKGIEYNTIPIGKPIDNIKLYVLNESLCLQPIGVIGELYIGGVGVGRGYLNNEGLTHEKFIPNPFEKGDTLYRTGDLARWLPDGNIDFLGRIDHQVKIRGNRIELGEIENQLIRSDILKDVAVIDIQDEKGDQNLVAYVVPDREKYYTLWKLQELLQRDDVRGKENFYHLLNHIPVFYINRNETEFMYREIFEETCYLKKGIQLKKDACIVDIGANIGIFSVFASLMFPESTVYSFEPIPPIHKVLDLNAQLYSDRIKVFNCGISSVEGVENFIYYPNASVLSGSFANKEEELKTVKAFIYNQEQPEIKEQLSSSQVNELLEERLKFSEFQCQLKTLSQVIKEDRISFIDLLKIDVEKGECEVLEGIDDQDWPKIKQIVIEVHDIDHRLDRILSLLEEKGFRVQEEQDDVLTSTDLYNVYAIRESFSLPDDHEARGLELEDNLYSQTKFIEGLKDTLREVLPDYMVPQYVVLLHQLPLTTSGKVDRKRLPAPEVVLSGEYIPPGNETEKKMQEIWSEVLNLDKKKISVDTNFFQIGGHSLKAAIMISRIHKELGFRFTLEEVFKTPYVSGLSKLAFTRDVEKELFESIPTAEQKDNYPASSAQKRLFFLQQLDLKSTHYNIPHVITFPSPEEPDTLKIENTFEKLMQRHEILRTTFHLFDQGEPVQKILDEVDIQLQEMDYERIPELKGEEKLSTIQAKIIEACTKSFDLSKAPLIRATLIGGRHLFIDLHHIITDGTSQEILVKEFFRIYNQEELPPLRLQYKDYSEWQRSSQRQALLKQQEDWWLEQFKEDIPLLTLPYDFPRPSFQEFKGATYHFVLENREYNILKEISSETETTKYMVLLSVFEILLSRLSNQEEIVVGVPTAARTHQDFMEMIGMFVNTLPFREHVSPEKKFFEFLNKLKTNLLKAFENQEYSFEELIEKLDLERDTSRNPVFDVTFNFLERHNLSLEEMISNGAPVNEHVRGTSKFDLNLSGMDFGDAIYLNLEYRTGLFKPDTINRIIVYFRNIIRKLPELKEKNIHEIEVYSEEEKHQLLYGFNDTKADFPETKTLHGIFDTVKEKNPDRIALIDQHQDQDSPGIITYSQLNEKSRQLSGKILTFVMGAGAIIGLMKGRSLETVIGVLGILKSGGAYLPIDAEYPGERIQYMLKDSAARVLLADPQQAEKASFEGAVISLDENHSTEGNVPEKSITANRSHDPAYIIYTSGTTGKPKGVLVEHLNVIRLLFNDKFQFDFSNQDTWTLFHSHCFDFSVWEMYGALLYGGKLVIIPVLLAKDSLEFLKVLRKEKVTVLNQTPSAFYNLVEMEKHAFGKENQRGMVVRYVIFGGEALKPGKLAYWYEKYPKIKLINMFGITETTVHVTYKEIGLYEIENNISNIGRPIPTLNGYVKDRYMKLQPIGVPGELCVGGPGVSRGYINQPELTSERFTPNHDIPEERMYRSGDLVKLLPDGEMEYLGRIDHQVQLRGFRIELGEIENRLLKINGVKDAVVLCKTDTQEEHFLCAYIVPEQKNNQPVIDMATVKSQLTRDLPGYMIPSFFVEMEQLPLKSNGKVDLKALPEPGIQPLEGSIAPRNDMEKKIAALWAGILDIDESVISVNSDFFDLGGHSLRATTFISLVRSQFKVDVSLAEFFKHSILKEFAEILQGAEIQKYNSILAIEKKEYYDLSYAQKRLWVICLLEENYSIYNEPSAVILEGNFQVELFEKAVQQVVNRNEMLRTVFILKDGVPRQKILENLDISVKLLDLRELNKGEKDHQAKEIYKQVAEGAFDFETGPLFRFQMVRLAEKRYLFIVNMHHIIVDGWSSGIMSNDVVLIYNALLKGEHLLLEQLKLQYKDYSEWQERFLQTGLLKSSEEYWFNKFEDKPNGIELPYDFQRGSKQTFNGQRLAFTIKGDELEGLMQVAQQENGTLFMMLLSIFSILLHKYSGQEDILIGSPIANRKQVELENMIGFISNTIVFRNSIKEKESFWETFRKIQEDAMESYEHQDFPFNLTVENLKMERMASHSVLYNVMFGHINIDTFDKNLALEGIGVENYQHVNEYNLSIFDLILVTVDQGDAITAKIEYNSDLFRKSTIERMIENFQQIIREIIDAPGNTLENMNLPAPEEKEKITRTFNGKKIQFPEKTLTELFEDQVVLNSDRLAAVYQDDTITYQELNRRINQLAFYLIEEFQVKPNDTVGISVDRSIDMIVGILGIIKSGAGYVSIDPNYPRERVHHILMDSNVQLIVIDQFRDELFKDYLGRIIHFDSESNNINGKSSDNPGIRNKPDDLLYVIYTSGSTGTPNGAKLSHDLLTNLIQWQSQETSIDSSLGCLQFTSINFCVSFQEIMNTLTSGGTLYLIGDIERQDINYLMEYLSKNQVENLYLPFSYLNFLFNESDRWDDTFQHNLKHIITAGEQLKITEPMRRFLNKNPGIQLHNHYGSSEMHVVTSYTMDHKTAASVPIPPAGKPVANTNIFILDENFKPLPIGAWGELFVEGRRELLGYMQGQGLDHKFVRVPELSEKRLYRSGDMGRWMEDGNIELRGRKDFQVKIRGFRVEPGEIESKILSISGVKECVVVVREECRNQKYLVAYVVVEKLKTSDIKNTISNYLPQYMIPEIVKLNKLPLMPNGKVDRELLPEPNAMEDVSETFQEEIVFDLLKNKDYSDQVATGDKALSAEASPEEIVAYYTLQLKKYDSMDSLEISRVEYNVFSDEKLVQQLMETVSLNTKNDTELPVTQLFERLAEINPEKPALKDGIKGKTLSYRELNEASNRFARLLISRGVKRNSVVAVISKPSSEMIIGILAILKAGGAYLHISTDTPAQKVYARLKENDVTLVLAGDIAFDIYSVTRLMDLSGGDKEFYETEERKPLQDLDLLPLPDRSLVDYETYSRFIGITMVKDCITLLTSRGCPYNCAYCHKIWPKKQISRSAENIFREVKLYYDMGVRRFAFIDDIFNLNIKNSIRFFQMVLNQGLKVQFFFSGGLRGDILTPGFIDLMIKAGTVNIAMALETACPRLQKFMGKELNVKKIRKNLEYISKNYPEVVLELHTMLGFPTETEEEARMTLDFIKSIQWLDFPYIHLVRIYSNTRMEQLAIENGISQEAISDCEDVAFHEWSETLPFEKSFTSNYQAEFLEEYFLSKERLLKVLPRQMKVLTEEDMVQKYHSYLPQNISNFDDLLRAVGITRDELEAKSCQDEDRMLVSDLNQKMAQHFFIDEPENTPLKILMLDLSQFFTAEGMLYDVVEAPLGLISLITYLKEQLGNKINVKIGKSRIDFDSFQSLKKFITDYKPDLIGIRTLTFYKDFFHQIVGMIRHWGIHVPIIAGGPYASTDYNTILQDPNVDLIVKGEGEVTFLKLMEKIVENNGKIPGDDTLKEILGLVIVPESQKTKETYIREIIPIDSWEEIISTEDTTNLEPVGNSTDPIQVLYPALREVSEEEKNAGVLIQHQQLNPLLTLLRGNEIPTTSILFDGAPHQVFGTLLMGGNILLLPGNTLSQNIQLMEFYNTQQSGLSIRLLNKTHLYGGQATQDQLVSPQDDVETRLVKIWSEVLDLEESAISILSNFFEIGGHSLKATLMASRVHKEFDVKVPLIEIFKTETVSGLAKYIKDAVKERFTPIQRVEKREYYQASSAQKRMYILYQVEKDSIFYNVPMKWILEGEFDVSLLEKAFTSLIIRHESLRTSFQIASGKICQKIHEPMAFKIPYDVLDEEKANDVSEGFVKSFDLSQVPLFRVRVIKLEEERHILLMDIHHIISDEVAQSIFNREMIALYTGTKLPELHYQYKDFSEWQNNLMQQGIKKKQEEYWLNVLTGELPRLNLPRDSQTSQVLDYKGSSLHFIISEEETQVLKELALKENATLYMMFLAIFNIFLSKISDKDDVVVGTPVAGRQHDDLEYIIGVFINTLVIRNYPEEEKTFIEFLREVRQRVLFAFENQDYQFDELVQKLDLERNIGQNPLFDVMFAMQNAKVTEGKLPEINIPGLSFLPQDIKRASVLDLYLSGADRGKTIAFVLEFSKSQFKEETVETFIRYFNEVVQSVAKNIHIKIKDIHISHDLYDEELENPDIDMDFLDGF
jgi:amino acid adenylation domain-containing protein/FkbM family methyltransferase